MSKTGQTSR